MPDGSFGPQIPGTNRIGGANAGVNLEQLGLSIGYARDLTDNFSIGVAALLAYQTIEVRGVGAFQGFTQTFTQNAIANQLGLTGRPVGSPTALSDNDADSSYGYGFQIGGLWDVNPQLSVGASFRTKMYMDEFSDYKDLFAERGDFDMPAVGTIGLAFRPNSQLTMALDVQQIWYSDVKSIANKNLLATNCNLSAAFGQGLPGTTYDPSYCLGGDNGAGFGWDDMTVFKLGVQYAINDTLTVRAGYSHADGPISGSEVAFNALAPAVIEDHWTLGATYKLRDNYELTFWGMYAPEETVRGPGAFTGGQSPSISMYQYELGVNFGWLFN
jgi:long-chain fatty acid transport protein